MIKMEKFHIVLVQGHSAEYRIGPHLEKWMQLEHQDLAAVVGQMELIVWQHEELGQVIVEKKWPRSIPY